MDKRHLWMYVGYSRVNWIILDKVAILPIVITSDRDSEITSDTRKLLKEEGYGSSFMTTYLISSVLPIITQVGMHACFG